MASDHCFHHTYLLLQVVTTFLNEAHFLYFAGQFLLEESRLTEAAEMAKKAAELDSTEFDVVFNAAHMLRLVLCLYFTRITLWLEESSSLY